MAELKRSAKKMGPLFMYSVALSLYIAGAVVVCLVALILSLLASTRPTAKNLVSGMAGSFPGVFLFQAIAIPIVILEVVVCLVIGLGLSAIGQIKVDLIFIGCVVAVFLTFLVMSALGFYAGWRVGWAWRAHRAIKPMIARDRLMSLIERCLFRWIPAYARLP